LNHSKNENIPTGEAACKIADQLAEEEHPIWGHRSKHIIESLINHKWAEN
jgi:hypothetical protein